MKQNFLQPNCSKMEAILVGTSNQIRSSTIASITFSGQNIPLSTSVTNLGVKMDPNLSFELRGEEGLMMPTANDSSMYLFMASVLGRDKKYRQPPGGSVPGIRSMAISYGRCEGRE